MNTICIENGYSIVKNQKPHGKSYNKWLSELVNTRKAPTEFFHLPYCFLLGFVRYCNNNLNCPIDSESTSWYIDTGGIDTVRINSWR